MNNYYAIINTATSTETVTYNYSIVADRFIDVAAKAVSHIITVDAALTAQELDAVFDEHIFNA
jgi:hypothetical protein